MKESVYSEEIKGLTLEGQNVEVAEVFDHWYDSECEYMKFLGQDERIYLIKRSKYGSWKVEEIYSY
jgi:hypothetical protein